MILHRVSKTIPNIVAVVLSNFSKFLTEIIHWNWLIDWYLILHVSWFIFPPHLAGVSALPGKKEKQENSICSFKRCISAEVVAKVSGNPFYATQYTTRLAVRRLAVWSIYVALPSTRNWAVEFCFTVCVASRHRLCRPSHRADSLSTPDRTLWCTQLGPLRHPSIGVARTEAERRVCELNQLTLPSFPLSSLPLSHIFKLTLPMDRQSIPFF